MIKYRVYDTEDKEYLDSFRTAITPDDEVFVLSDYKYNDDGQEIWEAKLVCSSRQEPGRFVVEQYTGLKDKNGAEIAVGDILMDDTGEPIEYWSVSFSDGSFIGECAGVSEGLFELTSLGVIGNIHENAELLEERG